MRFLTTASLLSLALLVHPSLASSAPASSVPSRTAPIVAPATSTLELKSLTVYGNNGATKIGTLSNAGGQLGTPQYLWDSKGPANLDANKEYKVIAEIRTVGGVPCTKPYVLNVTIWGGGNTAPVYKASHDVTTDPKKWIEVLSYSWGFKTQNPGQHSFLVTFKPKS